MQTVMATVGPASGRALEDQLVACVHSSLGLYLYDNSCFLCERLVAQFPSEVRGGGREPPPPLPPQPPQPPPPTE